MKKQRPPITIDPDIHSGDPVFTGTRVPVVTLFEHLESGLPLELFLENFPSVKRSTAEEVIRLAAKTLLEVQKAA